MRLVKLVAFSKDPKICKNLQIILTGIRLDIFDFVSDVVLFLINIRFIVGKIAYGKIDETWRLKEPEHLPEHPAIIPFKIVPFGRIFKGPGKKRRWQAVFEGQHQLVSSK